MDLLTWGRLANAIKKSRNDRHNFKLGPQLFCTTKIMVVCSNKQRWPICSWLKSLRVILINFIINLLFSTKTTFYWQYCSLTILQAWGSIIMIFITFLSQLATSMLPIVLLLPLPLCFVWLLPPIQKFILDILL